MCRFWTATNLRGQRIMRGCYTLVQDGKWKCWNMDNMGPLTMAVRLFVCLWFIDARNEVVTFSLCALFFTFFVSERKKINSSMHLEGKLFYTTGLHYQKAQVIDLVGKAAGSHSQMISVRKQLVPVPAGALLSKHVKGRERKKNS